MNLRGQTVVFLGGALLVLGGGAAVLSYLVFRPEFIEIETNDALKDLRFVSGILQTEMAGLENTNQDWAVWDQAYAFLQGRDSLFIGREVVPATFERLAIDQMLFFDESGRTVSSTGSAGGRLVFFDESMEPAWREGGVLSCLAAAGADSAGLMSLDGRMALVSIHDVLASDASGPRSGSLAFVRLLDDTGGAALLQAGSSLQAWISTGRDSQDLDPDTLVGVMGDSLVVSVVLPSLDGSPMFLNTALPRDIYKEAEIILLHFVMLVTLGGLIFSGITLALIQFLVVRRLKGFLGLIQESGASVEQPLDKKRTDEVSRIGMAIGPVLERLETMTGVLRKSEQNNSNLLRLIPDFMITLKRDLTIISARPGYGFEPPFRADAMEGMKLDDFEILDATAGEVREIVSRVLSENTVESISFGIRGTESARHYDARVVASGPDSVLIVARDVTQRMMAEEAATRLQRLESLGLLAGGIAHDFNNRLSTAIGSIELAMADFANPPPTVLRSLDRALDACIKAGDLTRKLLTFSSGGSPFFKPLDVEKLAHGSLDPLFRGIGISLRLDIRPGIWLIDADEDQMSQVFRSIATNSIEAIGGFGWFEMKAYNSIDPPVPGLQTGHYVTMEFNDSGPGIRGDLLRKVFEPYFTTKQDSPGLGLSLCHSIAVKHGGWIEALPGPGGRFRLQIPAVREIPGSSEQLPLSAMGGRARILVMDDDLQVLETIREMLETLDYTVETASDGGAALYRMAEAERTGRPFDLLVLDLVVPGGIGGLETLSRARARFGDVRAIVSSGYSSDSVLSEFSVHGFKAALRKPFNMEELSSTVRRLLASSGREGQNNVTGRDRKE